MIADFPTLIYLLVSGMVFLELLAAGMKKERLYGLFLHLRIGTCLAGILFIGVSLGRPPLFGPFEASIYIVCIMGFLARIFQKNTGTHLFSLFNSLGVLIILLTQWGKPMTLNDDYFMYGNLWVNLFFNFRLVAAAVLAHGASQYFAHLFVKKKQAEILSMGGRNTLLAGACLYLVSEWAGSIWCLNWFGDSWQWNKGFFKASILFLMIMSVCHLPPGSTQKKIVQGISGTLPGIFILWMIFYH